jgi:hypothetical protein
LGCNIKLRSANKECCGQAIGGVCSGDCSR